MRSRLLTTAIVILAMLLLAGTVLAQTSPNYDLSWHVVAGGGREGMTSGIHRINGTLGQFAIGPATSTDHFVGAGYWYGVGIGGGMAVYLPLLFNSQTP